MKNDNMNAPEIRFPGFTDPWEQRKLSDVADIIGGGTPSTDVPEYWDGDIDWYAPAEINDQIYVDHSERKITQLGLEKSSAKILPANKTVLFTSRAGIGKTAILQHDAATNQGFQSLVLNDDTNPYFIFTMTEMIKVKAEKVASGSTFVEISGKMLGKLEFMFPTYEEQIRIGDCFKHIDDIITLHQCKHYQDHSSVFAPQNASDMTSFTATWEQRKVKDVCSISTGKSNTQDKIDDGEYPFFVRSPIIEHSNKFLFDEEAVLTVGDGVGTGKVFHYVNGKYDLHQRVYRLYGFSEETDAKFFYHWFSSHFYDRVMSMTAKTSVDSVRLEMISDMVFVAPEVEEQRRIASCFSRLDDLITLHQCKHYQGHSSIFAPQKASDIALFTATWEQRKLGDQMYIKSRIGWQALTKKEYLDSGDYYLITGTDIDEDRHEVDLSRCYYVSRERYEMDDKIQVHEGDIIVTKDGTIGKVAMVKGLDKPATLNSHLFVLRDLSGKLNNRYLLQILNSHIFTSFVKSTKTGSTLTGLPQKTIVEFVFPVPNIEEQEKIAGCLDKLDNTITLHQRDYLQ